MPVKFNTEAFRALIGEVRTNDFTEARDTIEGWAFAFGAAHYALTGTELDGWRTLYRQSAMAHHLDTADYPEAMAWDMRAGSGEPAEVGATADDYAAAHRVMARWAAWHKIAAKLPHHPDVRTDGYDAVMENVMLDDIDADPWGVCRQWAGAVADVAYHVHGEILPGMRYGSGKPDRRSVTETWAGECVLGLVEAGTVTLADLESLYAVFSEWDDRLTEWGYEY